MPSIDMGLSGRAVLRSASSTQLSRRALDDALAAELHAREVAHVAAEVLCLQLRRVLAHLHCMRRCERCCEWRRKGRLGLRLHRAAGAHAAGDETGWAI